MRLSFLASGIAAVTQDSLVLGASLIPGAADGFVIEITESEGDLDGIGKSSAVSAAPLEGVENQVDLILLAVVERHRGLFNPSPGGYVG
jgi:hypothetical protein